MNFCDDPLSRSSPTPDDCSR